MGTTKSKISVINANANAKQAIIQKEYEMRRRLLITEKEITIEILKFKQDLKNHDEKTNEKNNT